jgi:hypothetical protein
MKALPHLLVPNPTQQQKAAAPGGLVYDHISLKLGKEERGGGGGEKGWLLQQASPPL